MTPDIRLSDNLFLRRLHSFTGALPLGVFLLFHIYANSYSLVGADTYNEHVEALRALPYLHLMEWAFIFLPLCYHAGYGLYVWYTGENNYPQYPYARNGLFFLQRVTGLIVMVFVAYHIYDQRLLTQPTYESVNRSISNPLVFVLYFIGIFSVACHMMNGLWNVSVKWGVAVGKGAQTVFLYVFSALGLGLAYLGLRALTGFIG